MKPYPEISNIYKRNPATGKAVIGQYSQPEYEYLFDSQWLATEKIDGINTRVIWDGGAISYHDRRDKGLLPPVLHQALSHIITAGDMAKVFGFDVCLYGEGYGKGIGKTGHQYLPDGVGFILFDVWIPDNNNRLGGWWLQRQDLEDVATKLNVPLVPIINHCGELGTISQTMSLSCAVRRVSDGLKSQLGNFTAEGLVLKPATELYLRNGKRIIVKVKERDY